MADKWVVIDQKQTSTMIDGVFQDAMQVTFRTSSNIVGTVIVPLKSYGPEAVHDAIEGRVQVIDQVSSL